MENKSYNQLLSRIIIIKNSTPYTTRHLPNEQSVRTDEWANRLVLPPSVGFLALLAEHDLGRGADGLVLVLDADGALDFHGPGDLLGGVAAADGRGQRAGDLPDHGHGAHVLVALLHLLQRRLQGLLPLLVAHVGQDGHPHDFAHVNPQQAVLLRDEPVGEDVHEGPEPPPDQAHGQEGRLEGLHDLLGRVKVQAAEDGVVDAEPDEGPDGLVEEELGPRADEAVAQGRAQVVGEDVPVVGAGPVRDEARERAANHAAAVEAADGLALVGLRGEVAQAVDEAADEGLGDDRVRGQARLVEAPVVARDRGQNLPNGPPSPEVRVYREEVEPEHQARAHHDGEVQRVVDHARLVLLRLQVLQPARALPVGLHVAVVPRPAGHRGDRRRRRRGLVVHQRRQGGRRLPPLRPAHPREQALLPGGGSGRP
mmetsp:Transcript_6711/g.17314  ORF Transcript_6711/g.17314 Transcript_6711/m.17314 type:complete len:425 (+) Transcript_6711:21-1295(+)